MPRGAVIALGMGAELPNRLPDGSITASSEWIHDQTGEEGRSDETGRALDARMPDSKKTFHEWYMLPAWTPRHDECHSTLDGEWLQIAFARPVELVAVETQGKYGGGGWGVVHSYDVADVPAMIVDMQRKHAPQSPYQTRDKVVELFKGR